MAAETWGCRVERRKRREMREEEDKQEEREVRRAERKVCVCPLQDEGFMS